MTSLIDLGGAVAMLGVEEIDIARRTRSYNSVGVAVISAPTAIHMSGVNVQTLGASAGQSAGGRAGLAGSTGINVDQTSQGQRTYGGIVIFSTEAILAADPTSAQESDEVTWRGTVYSVAHVDPWVAYGYYRTVCVKKVV